MGNPYISSAAVFLIDTLFSLYIIAVMLRFLLQWVRADFMNPVSQFLVKVTNPPLRPLQRIIPRMRNIDLAAVVLIIALQMLDLFLINLAMGRGMSAQGLFVSAVAEGLSTLITLFFITILIEVILSWIGPGTYNPAIALVHQINDPLMAPARRLIGPLGGIDLSPLIVIIVLQLTKILLVAPLSHFGASLG